MERTSDSNGPSCIGCFGAPGMMWASCLSVPRTHESAEKNPPQIRILNDDDRKWPLYRVPCISCQKITVGCLLHGARLLIGLESRAPSLCLTASASPLPIFSQQKHSEWEACRSQGPSGSYIGWVATTSPEKHQSVAMLQNAGLQNLSHIL